MFNAIVTHISRQGLAFQLMFLAWPRLLRTITEAEKGHWKLFWIFSLVTELYLSWVSITRPGVELSTSDHPQFQSPSSRFTSLRHQARQNDSLQPYLWLYVNIGGLLDPNFLKIFSGNIFNQQEDSLGIILNPNLGL